MKAYGLKGTLDKVKSATGPAQHLACAVCGLIMAGMFVGHVNTTLVCFWGGLSLAVILATVWMPREFLKYTLLADFFLSTVVLFQYLMKPDPTVITPVYHIMTASGMQQAARPSHSMHMSMIDQYAHVAALLWLALWSLYLANLVQRQILEHKRFLHDI
tara:strand:- start:7501 stop:7977 length:477 start_codon:yes stop_codon:yes gene_type:complete